MQTPRRHFDSSVRRFPLGHLPVLVAAVVASGLLLGIAILQPGLAWTRWAGLLPLFIVVCRCSPRVAFVCGALWGGTLYGVLLDGGIVSTATSTATAAVPLLLILLPAAYASVASSISTRIGYSPFLIAVAWIVLELVLAISPVPLQRGLLANTLGADHSVLSRLANLFGYICVAFLVAYANAMLLSVVLLIQIRRPAWDRCLVSETDAAPWRIPQFIGHYQLQPPLGFNSPRAPPTPA